jgi:hypothetical protein
VFLSADPDPEEVSPRFDFSLDNLMGYSRKFGFEIRKRSAHQSLDAEDGMFRVRKRPIARRGTDEYGAIVEEADATGNECGSGCVPDNLRSTVLHESRQTVGRSQVNADSVWCVHGATAKQDQPASPDQTPEPGGLNRFSCCYSESTQEGEYRIRGLKPGSGTNTNPG